MQPWLPGLITGLAGLGWAVWSWWRNERRVLSVHQHGDSAINCAHQPRDGCTIFMIEVSLTNNSPKRTIVIKDYWLEPPWREDRWWPIHDPKEIEEKNYRIYDTFIDYPREMAINYRRFEEGKIGPGDTIRGLFFAHGSAPIPVDLYGGEWIRARFVVTDTEGRRYVKPIGLWPHPSWPPSENQPQLPLPEYELDGFDRDPNAVIDPLKNR